MKITGADGSDLEKGKRGEQGAIVYRILVVDDEPSICHSLALGLLSADYQVDLANGGHPAIEKGCQQKYDILIVDLCLSDMYGIEVIRKFKEQNPQIISILMTAYPTKESSSEAKQLEINDLLEKPFHIQDIKDAILRGIAKRNLSDD
jgi:two-component system, NtrC family, response regulator AtoC